jgi:hypothetical protein
VSQASTKEQNEIVKNFIESEVTDITGDHIAPKYIPDELPAQKDIVEIALEN